MSTQALVIYTNEYLVTRTHFDLARAGDIEGVRAAQIKRRGSESTVYVADCECIMHDSTE